MQRHRVSTWFLQTGLGVYNAGILLTIIPLMWRNHIWRKQQWAPKSVDRALWTSTRERLTTTIPSELQAVSGSSSANICL
jgi:hypothetical protein